MITAYFKPNSRSAALLEEYLRLRGEKYIELKQAGMSDKEIDGLDDPLKPGAGRTSEETILVLAVANG